MKHLGWRALRATFWHSAKLLARGQTNFVRMLWKFSSVYNPTRQTADHSHPTPYAMTLPEHVTGVIPREQLFVHQPQSTVSEVS